MTKSSIVRVYNTRFNEWAEGVKVTLGFTGILNSGFTKDVYTNREGYACIDHASSGDAEIFVNGQKVGHIYAPGSATVHI
ncbi:MAG: hypothetical protein HOP11_10800 [Saprospiraceae bacterium]|nr:hypothetical protein [Saprospiraceae bacterium]